MYNLNWRTSKIGLQITQTPISAGICPSQCNRTWLRLMLSSYGENLLPASLSVEAFLKLEILVGEDGWKLLESQLSAHREILKVSTLLCFLIGFVWLLIQVGHWCLESHVVFLLVLNWENDISISKFGILWSYWIVLTVLGLCAMC